MRQQSDAQESQSDRKVIQLMTGGLPPAASESSWVVSDRRVTRASTSFF